MDFPTFQAELRRLGGAAHALAAIGAALRLYQTKQEADPAVQARLFAAVEAVLPAHSTGSIGAGFRCFGVCDLSDRGSDGSVPQC